MACVYISLSQQAGEREILLLLHFSLFFALGYKWWRGLYIIRCLPVVWRARVPQLSTMVCTQNGLEKKTENTNKRGERKKKKKKRSNSTGCLAGLSGLAQCAHTQPRQEALLRPAQELDLHFHYTHTRGILLPTTINGGPLAYLPLVSPFFFFWSTSRPSSPRCTPRI